MKLSIRKIRIIHPVALYYKRILTIRGQISPTLTEREDLSIQYGIYVCTSVVSYIFII